MSTPWAPNGVPFCWQPKEALRKIEQNVDQPATAMLVYLALTRIASDEESVRFVKPINYIAKLAAVGRRTVERRLADLERLELLSIERGHPGSVHVYGLRTLSRNPASQSRRGATQNWSEPVALIEEQKKGRKSPMSTAERIGLEKQITILKERLIKLEGDTAEQWQRDLRPELVQQRDDVRAEIKDRQDRLLALID